MRILLVEDNVDLANLTRLNLKKQGFAVDAAHSGEEALCLLESNENYDAVILDLILPDINGGDLLQNIKALAPKVPVLALTARDSREERTSGIQMGFDDYITKPFSHHELAARLRVLCRLCQFQPTEIIKIDPLRIFRESQIIFKNKLRIKVTLNEFRLLFYLAKNKGREVSVKELSESVWDVNSTNGTGKVITTISRLRKKIGDHQKKIIVTCKGGYVVGLAND